MRPLVTRTTSLARNLLMSTAESNSESSGRRSGERSSESFCGVWETAALKAEWRKQRCERVSRMGRRQRVPSAVKWRQRGCLMELVLMASRVISCSFLGAEGGTRVCVATTSRGHKLCAANHSLTICCGRDEQKPSTHTDSCTFLLTVFQQANSVCRW